ncbi:allophanate hydrolase [Thalassoporum mexicanum PCC 7367]|uniref:allophanate hydrolase n=1 Tax=Thalassoporum mexicanum TaxID=3457544 RepID=UPI00029FB697|nr:allophanate hydrolase [Pseudanabaena sp. PCC 7367]AFY70188.1 allophanate hydrolase [Pseudanabaena sp. PCC 7367]
MDLEGISNISLDINTLLLAYRSGQSVTAIVELIYERIATHEHNPIWITLLPKQQVLQAAAQLEAMRQDMPSLPLFGIPFALKDNIDANGVLTTAACPAFGYMPTEDAMVVEKLLAAGALLIGKTNLDQFATGLVGTRSPYGVCQNPFDDRYISGGSSSGSAVAVSAGLVSFALGTDTAGSGRVPAAFNNIVGLKPSRGLISNRGVVPACRSLDCVSIFALSCNDAELVLAACQGFDHQDIYCRDRPLPANQQALPKSSSQSLSRFRFGVPTQDWLEFFGDREYQQLFTTSISHLEAIGGQQVEIDYQPFYDAAQLLYSGPWVAERLAALASFFEHSADQTLEITSQIILGANKYTAVDVFESIYKLKSHQRSAAAEWQKMDLLLVPTTPTIYQISQVNEEPLQLNTNLGYYTNFVNLLDLCAIAIPSGFRTDHLPFGITLIAPAFNENLLISLGTKYQQQLNLPLGNTSITYHQVSQ